MVDAASLSYVNLALFALQVLVNANQNAFSPKEAGKPFTNDTLIRPAGYAFLIWLVIYVFTALMVVTDAFFPRLSFYSSAQIPGFLRACFTASCVVNMLWIVLFNWLRWVHVAAVDLVLMWLSLLPLYLYVTKASLSGSHVPWSQYVLSELAVRLYFSWVSAAAMLNIAVAAQTSSDGYLSLRAYIAMLAVLLVVVLTGTVFGRDPVIGLVGVWALVALAKRRDAAFTGEAQEDFLKLQACATFGATLIASFLVISTVHRFFNPQPRNRILPNHNALFYFLTNHQREKHLRHPIHLTKQLISSRKQAALVDLLGVISEQAAARPPQQPSSTAAATAATATAMSSPLQHHLPLINAGFFVTQLLVNANMNAFGSSSGEDSVNTTPDIPIAPAPYAFLIWLVIYAFVASTVAADVFYPQYSFFNYSAHPAVYRRYFLLACITNIAFVVFNNWLGVTHLATLDLFLLWGSLLPIYLLLVRHPAKHTIRPWVHYFVSEFSIRIYFGWVSTAALLMVAVSLQKMHDGYLGFSVYAFLLTLLLTLGISAFLYGGEPVVGLVVSWTLIGLAVRDDSFPDSTDRDFDKLQAAAALAAPIIPVIVLIDAGRKAYAYWKSRKASDVELIKPVMTFQTSADYGTV